MRKILFTLITLFAISALGDNIPITATDTGVSGAALSGGATSSAINMEAKGQHANQLSLTIAVTPGTTTRIQVKCYESELVASKFSQISFCNTSSTAACIPDLRQYTLSDYDTVGGIKYIPSHWGVLKQWVKCTITDPDAGSGTVTLTGSRSWQ